MNARYSIYREVHKGIRSLMTDLIVRSGRTDFTNITQVEALRVATRDAFLLLEGHAEHENKFVGPIVEQHRPDIAGEMFAEHDDQEHRLISLLAHLEEIDVESGDAAARGHWFVVELAGLLGEMLMHMSQEEHVIMPALWELMDDSALMQLEQELVSAIPPEKMASYLTWMLPAINDAERAEMLCGMQAHAPAELFNSVRGLAASVLTPEDDARLETALRAGAATAA